MKIFVYKNGISADSLIYSDNHEYINNDKTFVNDVYICYDELSNSENPNIHIYLKPFGKGPLYFLYNFITSSGISLPEIIIL